MNSIKKIAHKFIDILIFNPAVMLFFVTLGKKIAVYGYKSNQCLKNDFLPVPVHFYSPIPDIEDLKKRKVWNKKSKLIGIDFNEKKQLELLKQLGKKFGKECDWPISPTKNQAEFNIDNGCFSYGCAASLYTMIRNFKPKRIIEVGSGNSSKIISEAIARNKVENHTNCHHTIIDPFPNDYIKNHSVKYSKLIEKKVETVDPKIFDELKENDILFIDSSHSVKIGGDVIFLFLEILPRLNPGVIVHIHDINLPYEFPREYITSETFRQFWTEQYLLQAFLSCNKEFEIMLAMSYLMHDHSNQFKKAYPNFNPKIHISGSGSFWMRRKLISEKK